MQPQGCPGDGLRPAEGCLPFSQAPSGQALNLKRNAMVPFTALCGELEFSPARSGAGQRQKRNFELSGGETESQEREASSLRLLCRAKRSGLGSCWIGDTRWQREASRAKENAGGPLGLCTAATSFNLPLQF